MNWKTFEDTWEVSDTGLVRNRKTKKILSIRIRKDGYLDVKLNYKRYLLHRLVAILFLDNPHNFDQVNHKDGVRSNPHVNNLEWCNQTHNMKHAFSIGLFPIRKGEKNHRATISKETAEKIKEDLKTQSMASIARKYNVTYHVVTNIKRGLSWVD